MAEAPAHLFAADAMLGRPARWLRVLGLYWHGSHVRRMRRALQRVLPGWLE